jgi:hypothetical protein
MMAQLRSTFRLLRVSPLRSSTRAPIRCMATAEGKRSVKLLVAHILIKDKSKTELIDDLEQQLVAGTATFAQVQACSDGQGWRIQVLVTIC